MNRASLTHDLADIQRRLQLIAARNDRMHEMLALKIHRDAVAEESGDGPKGELDARCEVGFSRPQPPRRAA